MTAIAGRVGATLAVGSAVLHGFSLGDGVLEAATMAAMIVACLYCAYELWSHDTVRAWVLVALMNIVMIGIHLPMTGGHHHGAVPISAGGPAMVSVATGVAVLEIVLAVAVLFHRTRRVQLR